MPHSVIGTLLSSIWDEEKEPYLAIFEPVSSLVLGSSVSN